MKIPLGKPILGTEEKKALLKEMDGGYMASARIISEFEEALAEKFQRKYCVVVNSGTSALYLALKVLGVKRVIVPSVTCINVLHAVLNAGSEPIFADVEDKTHNIDLAGLSRTQLEATDSLIVTQAYGHAVAMDIAASLAHDYNLSLIEDFAQATGGYYRGKILGGFGKVSITSFYDTKTMATGHGGAIFTDEAEIYRKCLYARGDTVRERYENIIPMNLKMSGIQASVGLVQLRKLDSLVEMRRSVAREYGASLANTGLTLPYESSDVKHTYYKYHLMLPESLPKAEFVREMARRNISVGVCYDPPLHQSWLAQNMLHNQVQLPVTESLAPRTVSLPIFPGLNKCDISRICKAVVSILEKQRMVPR